MQKLLFKVEAIYEITSRPYSETHGSFSQQRGAINTEDAERQRLKRLSPYKNAEYKCLECIAELRSVLKLCNELSTPSSSLAPLSSLSTKGEDSARVLARARLAARRAHQRLRTLYQEVERLHRRRLTHDKPASVSPPFSHSLTPISKLEAEKKENGDEDFRKLSDQVERARQWYREKFGITVVSSSGDPQPFSYLQHPASEHDCDDSHDYHDDEAYPLVNEGRYPHENRSRETLFPEKMNESYPTPVERQSARENMLRYAREDEEFRLFYESLQRNDSLMDKALDRIESSVFRLRDNAKGISRDLNTQSELLNETEVRLNENAHELRSINRRLKRSLAEVKSSTVCSYVFCLLCLLLVLGLLIRVASQ